MSMNSPTTYRNTANLKILRNIKRQTNDLYIVHCGIQKCSPGYTYNHKVPNEYHLHFVIDGKGSLTVNDNTYSIQKNDIFLIPKGAFFNYHADYDDPWTYAWVTFDGNMASEYLAHTHLTTAIPLIHSAIPTDCYLPLIQSILDANQLTFANEIKRVAILYEIFAMLIESQNSIQTNCDNLDYSNDAYIDYALHFIKSNYKTITVSELANYIGINRSYLTTLFKKKLNVSPKQYLISFRLSESTKLLKNTDMNISEIAEAVGYENAHSYSKAFKQTYGVTPNTYRYMK